MRFFAYGVVFVLTVAITLICCTPAPPDTAAGHPGQSDGSSETGNSTPGEHRVSDGHILFSPLLSTTTYLIDKRGRAVHTWESEFPPGASVYLLDKGHLLRCGRHPDVPVFNAGGEGGRIQEFDWDGKLVWDFVLASADRLQHHDIEPLPNGNVLLVAWERKTREEAIEAGRDPNLLNRAGLWPDCILEIRPDPPANGEIVWEWHVWDHLVQDRDPSRRNYGSVVAHPELVDINVSRTPSSSDDEQVKRLRALGYIAGGSQAPDRNADFMHTNSITYDARLDRIVLTVWAFNEIWIIDHSTTTEEAAGHSGGRARRGGDLLYRWGNPEAYGRGTAGDRRLFGPHDARRIPAGHPGDGNILVFDNGAGRPSGQYSAVIEIRPPVNAAGRYLTGTGGQFGPMEPVWQYTAPDRESFFAEFISGAQRLRNGNTLICDGPQGRFFEVTPVGETVWEYRNPFSGDAPNPHGDPPYSVFRSTQIQPDHPGLAGRSLEPSAPQPPRR